MSYQVIARKYRPQRFADVIGQEHVTQTLTNAIRSERIAHAYLFCGPRGTGKTTIARIFAKALNCTGGPRIDFDDTDPRCREIAEGRSLDVLEIDGASNNSVEEVRELRETARFAPASSRFKIYIIDEVHMLTTAAFNALLKTLEEPPPHVKFLFATTDPEKVLPTILSRCQRFDLRRIPSALIVRHLATIAAKEGVEVDEAGLHAIARGADGGMRDAESTLDQLISFCGERIEEADVLSMFGLAARSQILALSRALLDDEPSTALRELDELVRNGKDLGRLLADLLNHFRNLLVYLVTAGDLSMMEVSEAEASELKSQSALAPMDAVTRVLEVLTTAEGQLRDVSARRIFLEVALLRAIQARKAVSLDAVVRQLQQLRQNSSVVPSASASEQDPQPVNPIPPGKTWTPAQVSSAGEVLRTPPQAIVAAGSTVATGAAEAAAGTSGGTPDAAAENQLDSIWKRVLSAATPMTREALQAGRPQAIKNGLLTIGYSPSVDHLRDIVDQDQTRRAIEARLADSGLTVSLRFLRLAVEESAPGPGAVTSAAPPPSVATPSAPGGAAASRTTLRPGSAGATSPRALSPPGSPPGVTQPARGEKVVPLKLDPQEFKNDPLIKEALELFRGHLVEVQQPAPPETGSGSAGTGGAPSGGL